MQKTDEVGSGSGRAVGKLHKELSGKKWEETEEEGEMKSERHEEGSGENGREPAVVENVCRSCAWIVVGASSEDGCCDFQGKQ